MGKDSASIKLQYGKNEKGRIDVYCQGFQNAETRSTELESELGAQLFESYKDELARKKIELEKELESL